MSIACEGVRLEQVHQLSVELGQTRLAGIVEDEHSIDHGVVVGFVLGRAIDGNAPGETAGNCDDMTCMWAVHKLVAGTPDLHSYTNPN